MRDRPAFPASRVLEVVRACEAAGVPVSVSGGWGLDALVGRQTREHHDLDLVVEGPSIAAVADALDGEGFARVAAAEAPNLDAETERRLTEAMHLLIEAATPSRDGLDAWAFDAIREAAMPLSPDLLAAIAEELPGEPLVDPTGQLDPSVLQRLMGRESPPPSMSIADAIRLLSQHGVLPDGDDALALLDATGRLEPTAAQRLLSAVHEAMSQMAESEASVRLRDPDGHVVMLHPNPVDPTGAQPGTVVARGSIDWVDVPCVPADVQAERLDGDMGWVDDRTLRDRLVLRDLTGIALPEGLMLRGLTGALPPDEVAAAYLRSYDRAFSGPGSEMVDVPDDPDGWAADLVWTATFYPTHATPETMEYGWRLILALVAAAEGPQIPYVAAGPVEDFLGLHGDAVIERVEAQASADPRFRHGSAVCGRTA
ncbi:MAG: hypothetical protein U0869_24150 [Chloroflexota bacterium]